jgi:putative peptidoglycan lipid II flippase
MSFSQVVRESDRGVALQVKAANTHVLRALLHLVSAALLLRVGGMVNQVIVSASFGAGAPMDAYFVAAAFPLLLVQLMGSAVEASVVPVYTRLRMLAGKEEVSRLFSMLLHCLLLLAFALVLGLFVLRRSLVLFSAPGLDSTRLAQAVELTPLLYLVVPLSLVSGLLECILNAEGQFGWPAYAGLLVPLVTALLTWLGGRHWGIPALCLGGLAGTALQLAAICVRARQAGLRYRLVMDVRNAELMRILRAAWPVLLGALVVQGGPLVDQIFASTLPASTISVVNYALKLTSVFIGVIVVSVGRAVLPSLARQAVLDDPRYLALKGTLRLYIWIIGGCTFVCSLLLLLLAYPLVQLLFQRGAFSALDARNTAIVVSGFAPGLVPSAVGFLLSRTCNALGETRVPMYIAFVGVGANAVFDALFAHFWQGLGIALATSLVSLMTSALFLLFLHRRLGGLHLWQVPAELQFVRICRRRVVHGSPHGRLWTVFSPGIWCRYGLVVCVTLPILVVGVVATLHDALTAVRVSLASLLTLVFLRHPYLLLLAWASVNVCIGSSLALFNGNNLDLALIAPLLLLVCSLPWRELVRRMPGLPWLGLYFAWVLASIDLSPLDTAAFLKFWLTMLACAAVGVLASELLTTRRRLHALVDALLLTALLVALYGLYGYVTRQHGEEDAPAQVFRITSLFTQATTFAFYLSLLIPLALYRCLFLRSLRRWGACVLALCLLLALLLTFTRTAVIAVVLEVSIMALCVPGRRMRFLMAGGLALALGAVFLLGWDGRLLLLARFFNGDLATLNGRVYLWQALLDHFQVTQWRGSGLQSSDQLLADLRVGGFGPGVIGTAPHSLFLGTLYDHGVPGLLLLSGVFLAQGVCLLREMRKSGGERRMLFAAALAALVALLLQSLGSRDLWIQSVGTSFWLVTALPFARCWPSSGTLVGTEPARKEVQPLKSPGISCHLPK